MSSSDLRPRLATLADELATTATTHLAADDERRAIVRRLRELLRETVMSTTTLRDVLAEHQNKGSDVRWDREEIDWTHWWRCGCGYEVTFADGGTYWFEDHVAAAILADPEPTPPPSTLARPTTHSQGG